MTAADIERAFGLFCRLRDARNHYCDYRHSEAQAFALAVESLASVPAAPKKRKGRVAPVAGARDRQAP